ncbi:MAG: ABC transporter ATP-binding protein [Clostridia bacterium]|nr:ABC transporter ATP-binding protein [Clostridia bacterium]
MSLMEVRQLTKAFGGLIALRDVSLEVREGEILSVIGPNGAGKSTLFNVVTGIHRPDAGSVFYRSREITHLSPSQRVAIGIAHTFQGVRLFPRMTVLENVVVGSRSRSRSGVLQALLGGRSFRREEADLIERAERCLAFVSPSLHARGNELACNLPYGDQRRVEIARALATEPDVVFFDEPAAGLSQAERRELARLIAAIRDRGVTIVLIEHDMRLVMSVSDRVVVLDQGAVIAVGTPQQVQRNPRVVEAYLGRRDRCEQAPEVPVAQVASL